MDIERLEQNIRYTFKNKELLKTALTHTSYAHEKKVESNEKLEFLGDSILEFVTSNYLYNNYRKLKEGEMTKVRASVVCESSLYQVALKHNFSSNLENAEKFIIENLKDQIEIASKHVGMKDYKTVLQEKLQIHGNVKIEYTVIDEKGPDHNKTFVVEVKCDGKHLAIGQGSTKKAAEMEAAHNALEGKNE